MSFVRLKYRLRHAIRPFFYLIVAIFLVGGAFSFDSYQKSQRSRRGLPGGKRHVAKYVATINGKRIPRTELDNYLYMVADRNYGLPVEIQRRAMTSWLEMKIDDIVMSQAESAEGIKVSDKEIRERREKMVDDELAPQIEERVALNNLLKKRKQTLEQYRKELIRNLTQSPRGSDSALRSEIAREKLEEKIKNSVQVTDEEVRASYTEVRARHILVRPKDLKRKALEKLDTEKADLEKKQQAAKDAGKTPDPATQTRLDAIAGEKEAAGKQDWDAAARQKAEEVLNKVKSGGDFAKLAEEYSDDPGSASRGGDLDYFRRGRMAKEFEDAAFALKVGEVSGVVKTDFGYHIIKVEGRRDQLPKDYDKNTAMYRDQYIEERKWKGWSDYESQLKKSAQVEVHDSELAAYRLLDDEEPDEDKALQLLTQAVQYDPGNAGARYELAQLWRGKDNQQKALELLLEVERMEGTDRSVELMMSLGDLFREMKRNDEALPRYKKAADLAAPVQPRNQYVHMRLEMAYRAMKQTDLADQERVWLENYQKSQEMSGGANPFGGMITVK